MNIWVGKNNWKCTYVNKREGWVEYIYYFYCSDTSPLCYYNNFVLLSVHWKRGKKGQNGHQTEIDREKCRQTKEKQTKKDIKKRHIGTGRQTKLEKRGGTRKRNHLNHIDIE